LFFFFLDRLRHAEREVSEYIVRQKQLLEEIDELSKKYEMILIDKHTTEMKYETNSKEYETKYVTLNQKYIMSQRKNDELTSELSILQRSYGILIDKSLLWEIEKKTNEEKIDSKNREINFLRETNDKRIHEFKKSENDKENHLRNKIDDLSKRIIEMNFKIDELNKEKEYLLREHTVTIKSIKEEENIKLKNIENDKSNLYIQMNSLQTKLFELETLKHKEISDLKIIIESSKLNINNLTNENTKLKTQYDVSIIDTQKMKDEYINKLKDATNTKTELDTLQEKYKLLCDKENHFLHEYEKNNFELQTIKNELNNLNIELENERESFNKNLNLNQSNWNSQKNILLHRIQQLETVTTKKN
jgi:hypothetical protein